MRGTTASKTRCGFGSKSVTPAAAPPDVPVWADETDGVYTITATAVGQQVSDGNLTLDNLGTKLPADKWSN